MGVTEARPLVDNFEACPTRYTLPTAFDHILVMPEGKEFGAITKKARAT